MTTTKYNFNGRIEHIDQDVLATAPTGKGKPTFFKLERYVSADDLENEYQSRNLIPATIESLAAYDKTNRKDMDNMEYVATSWKDANGKWCYASFRRWGAGARLVDVRRDDGVWFDYWWFAGFAGSSKTSELSSGSLSSDLAMENPAAWSDTVQKLDALIESLQELKKSLKN